MSPKRRWEDKFKEGKKGYNFLCTRHKSVLGEGGGQKYSSSHS